MRFVRILLSLCLFLMYSCSTGTHEKDKNNEADLTSETEQNCNYGFNTDGLILYEDVIQPDESLSEILLSYNVSYPVIDRLARNSEKIYAVDQFQSGKKYKLYCVEDSLITARYFIYYPNPIEYVVYELFDSLKAYKGHREVEIKIENASGVIFSSLWETMIDNSLSPALAISLSEVYAWQIDFFRIQKGDKFKIIYEKQYVEDQFAGIGKIMGAYFSHNEDDYYAILFKQNDQEDYFDEKGNSLRKAFLKAPLQYSRISSPYSKKRFHPVLKRNQPHLGTDYAAPKGTPIRTVGDGIVLEAQYKVGNGKYVKIRHNSTYTTAYLHMSKINDKIKPGMRVRQGQIIGYVGSTGLATGPHLCFRFYLNNEQVNPLKIKMPPSESVKNNHMDDFNDVKNDIIRKLEGIKFL